MNLVLFWKPAAWLLLIFYGLFLPADSLPVNPFLNIPHFDKMVHFGLFFIFCLLLFRPFKRLHVNFKFWAPFIALVFAAVLEWIQHYVSASRSSNLQDFAANMGGILTAWIIYIGLILGNRAEKFF